MQTLIEEITEYVKMVWGDEEAKYKDVLYQDVEQCIQQYGEFEKRLVSKKDCSSRLLRYINRPLMVYDMFMDGKIIVFRYDYFSDSESDESEESEETDSCYSEGDYDYDEHKLPGYVNGVKMLDEYDLREQITANEFTGGYLEPNYHWVISKDKLDAVLTKKEIK